VQHPQLGAILDFDHADPAARTERLKDAADLYAGASAARRASAPPIALKHTSASWCIQSAESRREGSIPSKRNSPSFFGRRD
jgi:hypothetical protein